MFDECAQVFTATAQADLGAFGGDTSFGKAMPAHIHALGLIETDNVGISRVGRGGDRFSRWWTQTWQLLTDTLLANGVVTDSEKADIWRACHDPTFVYRQYLMQSVWGRKPSQQ